MPPHELELAHGRGSPKAQDRTQQIVMLADVPAQILEQGRIRPPIGRQASLDLLDAVGDQLIAPRLELGGDQIRDDAVARRSHW